MEDLWGLIKEQAARKGVWAELWGQKERGLAVERRDRRLHALEAYQETLWAVRVIHRGRAGLSYTTQSQPEALIKAFEQAYENSLFSEEEGLEPPAQELPALTPLPAPRLSEGKMLQLLEEAEEAALAFDSRIHRIERASLSWQETQYGLFQTSGISATFTSGEVSFLFSVVARDQGEERSAWEWQSATSLEALDLKALARKAAFKAANLLSARPRSSFKAAVLFPPMVAVSLLHTLSASFSGEEVAKGRSQLADKLGKKVFSPWVTLIDDGLLPQGLETRPFDDEGVAQQKTLLVDEGRITAFLYDTLWGGRAGRSSTGNARRPSFKSLPAVAPTNFYLAPEKGVPPAELRSGKVFEVYEMLGWHTTDPVSGDFSVGISGILHQNGTQEPLAGMALSGNLFQLLTRIEALGEDLTFYGGLGSPSLLVGELDLSGPSLA